MGTIFLKFSAEEPTVWTTLVSCWVPGRLLKFRRDLQVEWRDRPQVGLHNPFLVHPPFQKGSLLVLRVQHRVVHLFFLNVELLAANDKRPGSITPLNQSAVAFHLPLSIVLPGCSQQSRRLILASLRPGWHLVCTATSETKTRGTL